MTENGRTGCAAVRPVSAGAQLAGRIHPEKLDMATLPRGGAVHQPQAERSHVPAAIRRGGHTTRGRPLLESARPQLRFRSDPSRRFAVPRPAARAVGSLGQRRDSNRHGEVEAKLPRVQAEWIPVVPWNQDAR